MVGIQSTKIATVVENSSWFMRMNKKVSNSVFKVFGNTLIANIIEI